tara:strand:- start:4760 stop:5209 length:450 start_codon:yes stop_codon:yes gene_type:complete
MNIPQVNYAGTIIVNENYQVLFVFSDGIWEFPHGFMRAGESKKQAALRVAVEHTNIDPANIRILKELPPVWEMEGEAIKSTTLYICEYESNPDYKLRANFEDNGVFESKWFFMSQMPAFASNIAHKYIINFIAKLFSRTSILYRSTPKS